MLQATALELRAEELSLKGDLKSGLLYEVATRREEVKKLQAELGARIERAATIEFEAREATLRADKLATDAAQLGTTVSHLTRELDAAMQKVLALEQVCFTVHCMAWTNFVAACAPPPLLCDNVLHIRLRACMRS